MHYVQCKVGPRVSFSRKSVMALRFSACRVRYSSGHVETNCPGIPSRDQCRVFLLGWAHKEYTSFSFAISTRNVALTIKNFVQNGGGVSAEMGNLPPPPPPPPPTTTTTTTTRVSSRPSMRYRVYYQNGDTPLLTVCDYNHR